METPFSPWQAMQTSRTLALPFATSARARICRTSGVQTTCDTGVGGVLSENCGTAGEPGSIPSARQIAVKASMPALRPCTTGITMTPSRIPTSTIPITAMVDQMRQGWSRTWGSDCSGRWSVMSSHPVHDRCRGRLDHELGDWKAIGQNHQHQHALRRVNGKRIERAGNRLHAAAVKHHEISDEQDRGNQQDESADKRDHHPWAPSGDDRIGIVEVCDPAPLPLQAEPMPGQRHDHHANEPEPELNPQWSERWMIMPGEARPDFVSNGEVHDHHRPAEDQVKVRR